ncbi:MAG: PLP-dependent aminotransferase family protein [Acidobacteriaceae bacterium]|nr:PLP-dependent aminotransferase family protein [Acidobacteriaceae bacterium]
MVDLRQLPLDPAADRPVYRQLADALRAMIERETLRSGDKLPPTRQLAEQLGLNRTTVSAAYSLLEQSGLIHGHVGRGSFVARSASRTSSSQRNWEAILPPVETVSSPAPKIDISFASSRPAAHDFPVADFRRVTKQVVDSPETGEILQLGSSYGYAPLRRYLLDQAMASGVARHSDDIIITNGCQQALDLIARVFVARNTGVLVEDPGYHGVLRLFSRAGSETVSANVDDAGIDPDAIEQVLERSRPRLMVITPSFQNPTGVTLPLERRRRIVSLAERSGCVLVENDMYRELRYTGTDVPALKELDDTGNTILLRSYSKVCFPGLRVGWVIAPRPVIARLAEAKEICDLHSDQLSQAVLLGFAESGELARHIERTRRAGAERLNAVLNACARYLPKGTRFTRPQGGMNLWIDLPAPLTADTLLSRVQERGVNFLPGRYFSARHSHGRGLRISFGGLSPGQITRGFQILGEAIKRELAASVSSEDLEPAAALV